MVVVVYNSWLPVPNESAATMDGGIAYEVTDQNFEDLMDCSDDKVVMVNFWSDACPPSLQHATIMDEAAQRLNGRLLVGNVNLDEQSELGLELGIRRIPTLLFFKEGQAIRRAIGVHTRQMIFYEIEAAMELDKDASREF